MKLIASVLLLAAGCSEAFVPHHTSNLQTQPTSSSTTAVTFLPSSSTSSSRIILASEEGDVTEKVEEEAAPVKAKEQETPHTAYVVNLPYDTSNKELRDVFGQCGEVDKIYMPMDRESGRSKGIAFVTMSTLEELECAISTIHETEVNGRKIFVNKAKPRGASPDAKEKGTKLYVGNISYDTTTDELLEFFSQYGPVRDCYAPTDQNTGMPRGFAFLTLSTEDATKAIEQADGIELGGRIIEVKVSLPRGAKAPPRQIKPRNEIKLYVGNLSFDTEEETLREIFERFGPLIDFYMPYDRYSGRPRGFSFVTLGPESAAQAIEELDGYELDGRILRVNEAQPKGFSNDNKGSYDDEEYGDDESYDGEDDGSWGSEEY